MCELHRWKCIGCQLVWTTHKKVDRCESADPNAVCRSTLCVYVGDPKKPTRSECGGCKADRERREDEEEEAAWEARRQRRRDEEAARRTRGESSA